MSTPTPDDYRAALALIDGYAPATPVMAAVYAVARAAIDCGHAHAALNAPDAPWLGDGREALADALDATSKSYNAAVADLIALAKGGAA